MATARLSTGDTFWRVRYLVSAGGGRGVACEGTRAGRGECRAWRGDGGGLIGQFRGGERENGGRLSAGALARCGGGAG